MNYLAIEQVLFIHDRVIRETGGSPGVRDWGLLQSALARPLATFEGQEVYPDISTKAAAIFESLARNHSFVDGNKRTAFLSVVMFLRLNGYLFLASNEEVYQFTLSMAQGKCEFEAITRWIEDHSGS